MQTQWVYAGRGVRVGLNYQGVQIVIDRLGLNVEPQDWAMLQLLERETLAADVEQIEKGAKNG